MGRCIFIRVLAQHVATFLWLTVKIVLGVFLRFIAYALVVKLDTSPRWNINNCINYTDVYFPVPSKQSLHIHSNGNRSVLDERLSLNIVKNF